MKPAKTKLLCVGCHCDFYNGKNDLGVEECWSYSDAEVIKKKRVSIDQRPPWNQEATWMMKCYRAPGFIFVDKHVTC